MTSWTSKVGRIAIIPARGGSKRIPRKNVRLFAGMPMIAHSIICALESALFDQVIVSTDDEEIAGLSKSYGATVPFVRPPELSSDYASTADVMAHAVSQPSIAQENNSAICCIYATAPFLQKSDLKQALEILEAGTAQYVFPATTYAYPVFRAFSETDRGGLQMLFPEHHEARSQDLPEVLHDAGQFYWGRPQAWLDKIDDLGENSAVVRIPRWRAIDIDTEEDWVFAEKLALRASIT